MYNNRIMKLYYFYTLKALWVGQGKIKMYYGMSRVKKQLSGERSIINYFCIEKNLFKNRKMEKECFSR